MSVNRHPRRNIALGVAVTLSPVLVLPFLGFFGSGVVAAAGIKTIVCAAAGTKAIGYVAAGIKAIAHVASAIKGVGHVAVGIKAIGHFVAGTKVVTGAKATTTRVAAGTKAITAIKTRGQVAAVRALAIAKSGKATAVMTAFGTGFGLGRATANQDSREQDPTDQDATGEGATGNEGLDSTNFFHDIEL